MGVSLPYIGFLWGFFVGGLLVGVRGWDVLFPVFLTFVILLLYVIMAWGRGWLLVWFIFQTSFILHSIWIGGR